MSSYALTKSTTDQSVTTIDNTGLETDMMTSIMGSGNSTSVQDNSGNAGVQVGEGARVDGDLTLTTTDHGAIKGGLDFASQFGLSSLDFGRDALEAVKQSSQSAVQAATSSSARAFDDLAAAQQAATQGGSQKTIVWVIAGALVVAGLAVYMASKK